MEFHVLLFNNLSALFKQNLEISIVIILSFFYIITQAQI